MKNSMKLLKIATFLSIFLTLNACKKECAPPPIDGQNTIGDNKSKVKYFITTTGSTDYAALKFDFFFAKTKEIAANGDSITTDLDIKFKTFAFETYFNVVKDSLGVGTFGQNPITQFELKISNAKASTSLLIQNNEIGLGQTQSVILPISIVPKDKFDYEITFEINTDESVLELPDGVLKFEPKIKVIVVEK
jgi:hypothetical protein